MPKTKRDVGFDFETSGADGSAVTLHVPHREAVGLVDGFRRWSAMVDAKGDGTLIEEDEVYASVYDKCESLAERLAERLGMGSGDEAAEEYWDDHFAEFKDELVARVREIAESYG